MKNLLLKLLSLLVVISIAITVLYKMPTNLGLDLKGGIRLILEARPAGEQAIDQDTMTGIIQVIQQRIDGLGVSEPLIQKKGFKQIIIELPGIIDPERAISLIGKTAQLDFFKSEWAPENLDTLSPEKQKVLLGSNANIRSLDLGDGIKRSLNLKEKVLTGNDLNYVGPGTDEYGNPVVQIKFKSKGADTFYKVTNSWQGKPLAILLDDTVISAPRINGPIGGGEAIIQGNFSIQEMRDLVIQLKAGALPAPVDVISNTIVGPTLGQDSIKKSIQAGIIGITGVALYICLAYKLKGLIACLALCLYTLLTFALLKLIGATLTLPGIAGFILTIGMAVDANVIVFERIKEQMKKGDNQVLALKIGFKKGFKTILDSNITTVLAALVLFWLGTGTIKGFAITLSIGIFMSMFSAVFITRLLLDLGAQLWKK